MKPATGQFLNPHGVRKAKPRPKKYLIDGKWTERQQIIEDLGLSNGKFCSLMKLYDNDVNLVIRKVNEKAN